MKPILTMVLSALLTAWSLPATPLGLGEIDVRSHLGQRFDARIPISATADEIAAAKATTAKLAGADAYASAGVELSAPLRALSVAVQAEPTPAIVISSSTPINEPYLEIIIDADAGGQKLSRNYTVLLDPLVGNRNAKTVPPPPPPQPPVVRSQVPSKPAVVAAPASAAAPATARTIPDSPAISGPAQKMYGPVKPRETLASIALAVRPDNRVMIDQTAYAIYKANPKIFSQGIYARLTGRMLKVPSREEITAVSAELAQAQMNRLREAGVRKPTKAETEPAQTEAATKPESAAATPTVETLAAAPAEKPEKLNKADKADKAELAAAPAPAPAPAADKTEDAEKPEKTITSAGPKVSIYGPVKPGETLWSIAARMNPDPSIPVQDVLKAIHRANPRSFDGSINGLMKGAMLRIPDADEIRGRRKTTAAADNASVAPPPTDAKAVAEAKTPVETKKPAEEKKPLDDKKAVETKKPATKPELPTPDAPATTGKAPAEATPGPGTAPAVTPVPPPAAPAGVEAPASAPAETAESAPMVPPPTPVDVTPAVPAEQDDNKKPQFEIRLPKMLQGLGLESLGLEGTDWVDVLLLPLVLLTLVASAVLWVVAIIRRWAASRKQPAPWTLPPDPATGGPGFDLREPPPPAGPFVEIPVSEQTEVPLPDPEPAFEAEAEIDTAPAPLLTEPAAVPPPAVAAAAERKPAPPRPSSLTESLADAEVNMAFGLYDEAIPALERVHAERPDDLDVTRKLAKALLMAGRRDEFERLVPAPVEPRMPAAPVRAAELRVEPAPAVPPPPVVAPVVVETPAQPFTPAPAVAPAPPPVAAPAPVIVPLELPAELTQKPAPAAAETVRWTMPETATPVFAPFAPEAEPAPAPAPAATANWADEPAFQLDDFELEIPPLVDSAPAAPVVAAAPAPAPAPVAPSAPAPAADPGMIEFDLSEFDLSPITEAPSTPAVDAFDTAATVDFMLPDSEPVTAPAAPKPASAPAPGASGFQSGELPQFDEFDLDLDVDGHQAFSGDEAGTKLDLARAYIEMGDNEMARGLLNEVLQNGDAKQCDDARGLLSRLG